MASRDVRLTGTQGAAERARRGRRRAEEHFAFAPRAGCRARPVRPVWSPNDSGWPLGMCASQERRVRRSGLDGVGGEPKSILLLRPEQDVAPDRCGLSGARSRDVRLTGTQGAAERARRGRRRAEEHFAFAPRAGCRARPVRPVWSPSDSGWPLGMCASQERRVRRSGLDGVGGEPKSILLLRPEQDVAPDRCGLSGARTIADGLSGCAPHRNAGCGGAGSTG